MDPVPCNPPEAAHPHHHGRGYQERSSMVLEVMDTACTAEILNTEFFFFQIQRRIQDFPEGLRQPIFWQFFCQKLHEKEN